MSDETNRCYRVATNRVAQGGFGEVYRGVELDDHRDPVREVAIKVSLDSIAWHGEAYFGRLLADEPHVVPQLDAFPVVDGAGRARQVKYILVLAWMAEGTVNDALSTADTGWPEKEVTRQVAALLRVLVLLHRRGIRHGDITPRNVFVEDDDLLLGDLGIAKQGLRDGPIEMYGAAPWPFVPPDSDRFFWSLSEDVYQVGLLALSLLAGEEMTSYEVSGAVLKSLSASDHLKGWIREALALQPGRFVDAEEALSALLAEPVKPARAPRTLKGQKVVFTGKLPVGRLAAQARAESAGALVQNRVNGATTVIVAGQPTALQIGQRAGTKLFDAHRRIRRGQRIAIINASQFDRLAAVPSQEATPRP